MNRFFHYPVLVLILACFLVGCVRQNDKTDQPKGDSAVRLDGEQGLKLKLLEFSWHNYTANAEVKVKGTVQNLTGNTIQGCRIIVDGFDEKGDSLGHNETFLQPTVLKPNAIAGFSFSFDSPKEIKSLHLKYRFGARSEES